MTTATPTPPPPTPPPGPPDVTPIPLSRRALWLGVAACVVFLGAGVWFISAKLPRWLGAAGQKTPAEAAAAPTEGARKIHATLFYVSEDGSELVPVSQEVPYGATPGDQARRIADAQVQPAPAGFTSAIPPGTTVRGLYIAGKGEAYLDLSHEIITGHTGGSLDEALTVYALVDALTVNMPDIAAVQILVDGKEVDTLAGHIDLRHPLSRSLKWVRKGP
jgi:hypothetical protein